MNKKWLAALAGTALLHLPALPGIAPAAAGDAVPIVVDGQTASAAGRIIEERTFVPLHVAGEILGLQADEAGKAVPVTLRSEDGRHVIKIGEQGVSVNNHDLQWEVPPVTVDGTTYVPLRFLAENTGFAVTWDKQERAVHLRRLAENRIVIQTVKEEKTLPEFNGTIKIQYPQIEGLPDPDVRQRINEMLAKHAQTAKESGLKSLEEQAPYIHDIPNFQSEILVDYTVKYNQNGLLSLFFEDYTYFGGAHGMTVRTAYTVELKTGKLYALEDLFKEKADYVNWLNGEIKRQMAEKDMFLLKPFESIGKNQEFYLSTDGLVIFFQLYEYAPYVAGFPEFVIPYSRLADLLNEDLKVLAESRKP